MIKLALRYDATAVMKKLTQLKDGLAEKVATRALNRIADQVRTQATREISGQFNLTSTQVRQRITIGRASVAQNKLSVEVAVPMVKGRYRALHISDLKGTKDLRNAFGRVAGNTMRMAKRDRKGNIVTKAGVQYSILKGKTQTKPHAFIAPGKNSGKLIVFQRADINNPKSKLQAQYLIDVPQMFNARRIKDALVKLIDAKLPAEVERLLRVELAK